MSAGVLTGSTTQPFRVGKGTTNLDVAAGTFLSGVTDNGDGTFSFNETGIHQILLEMLPSGVQRDYPYAIQLFNVTQATVAQSFNRNAPLPVSGAPDSSFIAFVIDVALAPDKYVFRIVCNPQNGDPTNIINLDSPSFRAVITPFGDSTTGSGTTNQIAKWTSPSALGDSSLSDDGVKVTGTLPFRQPAGTAGIPSFSFSGDTDTGIYNSAANNFDISIGGVNKLNLTTSTVNFGLGVGTVNFLDTGGHNFTFGSPTTADTVGSPVTVQMALGTGTASSTYIFFNFGYSDGTPGTGLNVGTNGFSVGVTLSGASSATDNLDIAPIYLQTVAAGADFGAQPIGGDFVIVPGVGSTSAGSPTGGGRDGLFSVQSSSVNTNRISLASDDSGRGWLLGSTGNTTIILAPGDNSATATFFNTTTVDFAIPVRSISTSAQAISLIGSGGGMGIGSLGVYSFYSTATGTAADTGMSRIAAGVTGFGTGAQGSVAGAVRFAGTNALQSRMNTATSADALASFLMASSATTQKVLVLQAIAAQTANVFETQTSAGAVVFSQDGSATGSTITTSTSISAFRVSGAAGGVLIGSTGTYTFASTTTGATADLGLSRVSGGVLGVGTGAQGAINAAILWAGNAVLQSRMNVPVTSDTTVDLLITCSSATQTGLAVQGFTGQTANKFEVQTAGGGIDMAVTSAGIILGGNAGKAFVTTAAAGSVALGTTGRFEWTNNTSGNAGALDTGITRIAAAVIGFGDGTATSADGAIRFAGTNTLQSRMNVATTADALASFLMGASATTQKVLVLQALAAQTANVFEVQASTGVVGFSVTAAGALFVLSNIVLDTVTGTKIGTSTAQKLSFYNSTPIVQPTAPSAAGAAVATTASTNVAPFGYTTAAQADDIITQLNLSTARLNSIYTKLQSLGLMA